MWLVLIVQWKYDSILCAPHRELQSRPIVASFFFVTFVSWVLSPTPTHHTQPDLPTSHIYIQISYDAADRSTNNALGLGLILKNVNMQKDTFLKVIQMYKMC